ncbi:MAG TPA: response regulator [Candidatus Acidoferrales bacterium]|nr:response regulator [Candidatus Acidoferrales bacterium]
MSDMPTLLTEHVPTVYFIDDSATMREVIKIAFRRESINVITCADAASALAQFGESAPDAVITDVIMPDKDGYEVCQLIKQNPDLQKTPVILMSGVVNRTVAEKAIAVQADELIRKPFQPQELITRIKNLLNPKPAQAGTAAANISVAPQAVRPAAETLSGIFSAPAAPPMVPAAVSPASNGGMNRPGATASEVSSAPATARPNGGSGTKSPVSISADAQKLRFEIKRLEMLVKKLQSDLEAEREYAASLEAHLKTLQEAD